MKQQRTYSAQSPLLFPQEFAKQTLLELNTVKHIGWQLFKQSFRTRYRQSFLGYTWTIIPPIVMMIVASIMHGAKIVNYSDSQIPYPVFVLCGTLIWQLFSESFQGMVNLIYSKKSLLSRIPFPREALIVTQLIDGHVSLCILAIPLFILSYVFGANLGYNFVLSILLLSSTIVFGTILGTLIAPLAFLVEDIKRVLTIFLSFLFLVTPVIYKEPKQSVLREIVNLNPLTQLIGINRDLILGTNSTHILVPIMILLCCLAMLLFTWFIFRLAAPIALERAGNL